ncbi:hypothetical protein FB45DRAFT_1067283 [Roridomyces roridus]|uniref:Elongation factor 2 n=1 Tax=Roridomyces roridus TaxID=1738132 RepID=A0AAD7F8J4_9AGAR|nr:hypothetical protein FB45DRAFT_1067283 [Roridomyces roridus]
MSENEWIQISAGNSLGYPWTMFSKRISQTRGANSPRTPRVLGTLHCWAKVCALKTRGIFTHLCTTAGQFMMALLWKLTCFVGPRGWGSYEYPRDPSVFRVKCPTVSQVFKLPEESQEKNHGPFLINSTEATMDCLSELSSLLRVGDGAVLVVDVLDPVTEDTHAILRNTLDERVKPILFIDNIGRVVLPQEELYLCLRDAIQKVNDILSAHPQPVRVDAAEGSVVFGSTLHSLCASSLAATPRSLGLTKKRCFSKWSRQDDGTLPRAFCQLVLEPIYTLSRVVMDSDAQEIDRILEKLNITLDPFEREHGGNLLLKSIMSNFLPVSDALLEAVVIHLHPLSQRSAAGIRNCDPAGPLVVHISRMMPILSQDTLKDDKRVWAFGRVFSGTLRRGQKVRILGPSYVPGQKDDLFVRNIGDLIITSGRSVQPGVEEVPAGSFVGIEGVENFLVQSGTLTNCETTSPLRAGPSSVAVVQVGLEILQCSELPSVRAELRKLPKCYPRAWVSDIPEVPILAGPNQIQLDIFVKYLKSQFREGTFQASAPTVFYRETITAASSMPAVVESPNKKIRISVTATPLKPSLTRALEESYGGFRGPTMRHERFADATGWSDAQIRSKVWCLGRDDLAGVNFEGNGTNVLVNATRGHHMLECKDDIISGFRRAMTEGLCTKDPVRGVQLDIVGRQLEPGTTSSMREKDQIIPMVRRACHAAILLAQPRVQEPIYSVEIHHSEPGQADAIHTYLENRRGIILEDAATINPRTTIKAHLPVSESFGLATHLESSYSAAVMRMVFDHWRTVPGCPFASPSDTIVYNAEALLLLGVLEEGTPAHQLATSIRIRKGLEPTYNPSYLDLV